MPDNLTPRERAGIALAGVGAWSGNAVPKLLDAITTAIEAAVAEEKQRADEAEADVARCREIAERDGADYSAVLAREAESTALLHGEREQHQKEMEEALAREAALRRALEPFAGAAECVLADGHKETDYNSPLSSQDTGDDYCGLWDGDKRLSLLDLFAARTALAVPSPGLEQVRREAMERMLNVARGCHDYGGGYRGTEQFDAYQAGIATVVTALEHRIKDSADTQCNALEMMGRAAELRKGGE